jgi:N-methylhydantoinase A
MTKLRVAVDVGGTFTDVCVYDEASDRIRVAKVPSTTDLIDGVFNGLDQAGVKASEIALLAHGTTVATNALITRNLPEAALVTTEGFRDVLEIRRGTKPDLWDTYRDAAPPYIPRRRRFVVKERIDYAGEVVDALDEAQAHRLAKLLQRKGIEAVAVCFMNSYANPQHEQKMVEILRAYLPDASISASSAVLPEIFEHERFSTTVVNAVLGPVVGRYAEQLGKELVDQGYAGDLLLLHSGGGVMTPKTVTQFAARLAGSGLAAGAIAAQNVAEVCGLENAIGLDMGGTSTDISLVHGGDLHVTKEWSIEYGYPICFPSIDVLTIGAGGGSIAWIDEAGSLRNGPQSAGATPGPACYGRGNTAPTNTDANLVLGRLGASLIGGAMQLDVKAAEDAIETAIAQPLGLELFEAAAAILKVANANMADAVRLMSIQRGYDPRDFALVVFGGAGPLHGVELARELSIPTVLVPPNPGVTSALGCLLVDVRHDLSTMLVGRADSVRLEDVEQKFLALEEEAQQRLSVEGFAAADIRLDRTIDMRYLGQWRSLAVPAKRPITSLDEAVARFHDAHQREHDYRRDDTPVEIYRLNVRAIGATQKARLPRSAAQATIPEPVGSRTVRFDGRHNVVEAQVYDRATLTAGAAFAGPAVVEQLDSTILLPPDCRAVVDESMNIRIEVEC